MSYNYKQNTKTNELQNLAEQAKDEGDISQLIGFYEQEQMKEKIRRLNEPEKHPDFDGKNCVDCSGAIPEERLKMKKVRCVECQQELDDYNKRKNR